MKYLLRTGLLLVLITHQVSAQNQLIDSLKLHLEENIQDSLRIQILNTLAYQLNYYDPADGIALASQALQLALETNDEFLVARSRYCRGMGYWFWVDSFKLKDFESVNRRSRTTYILVII